MKDGSIGLKGGVALAEHSASEVILQSAFYCRRQSLRCPVGPLPACSMGTSAGGLFLLLVLATSARIGGHCRGRPGLSPPGTFALLKCWLVNLFAF